MLIYFTFVNHGYLSEYYWCITAKLLNIKPLLGLTAGSMSMEGGHGNAAAYGKTLQDMGVDSAVAAALAATLGLVFGGLIGGPIVKYLIKRYDLKPEHRDDSFKNYGVVEYNQSLHTKYKPIQVFLYNFLYSYFAWH